MMKYMTQGGVLAKALPCLALCLGIFIVLHLGAEQAWADPIGTSQLTVSVGVNTFTLYDYDGDGVISYNGSIGNFSLVVSTSASRPMLGSASAPHLDLNSIQINGSGSGTITIALTDTGFTDLEPGLTGFTSMIGGSCWSCTGTFSTYLDASNTPFGTATLLGQTTFGPPAFSSSFSSGNLPSTYPYSLTEIVSITHSGGWQSSSFNAEIQATPEPGSLVLLGSGMAGLGLLAWRRSKKT
jgi:hypothetical protein